MKRKAMAVAAASMLTMGAGMASAGEKFTFGVMSDTQQTGWYTPGEDGLNTVPTQIIDGVNQRFIDSGVKFVIQVGDLCNTDSSSNTTALQTRLDHTQALTNAGIPFYALRGNHDDLNNSQTFFQNNFIPTSTPDATVSVAAFDQTSYSVTYKNTKVLLLDINTAYSTTLMDSANAWMETELQADDHQQAFVFQHKNLLGQNHKDNQFGGGNDANPDRQNEYFRILDENNVKYSVSGHDHMHHRSLVTSPDGEHQVQEIITASDSTKFYDNDSGFSSRETSFADEQYQIGYYLFTVDGPRVTAEHWATPSTNPGHGNGGMPADPDWTLRETFGYSLNGKQFTIGRDQSYTTVTDAIAPGNGFQGTSMSILDGINSVTATAEGDRPCADDLNTGWEERQPGLASDILYLWGMQNDLGSEQTDTFVLSMSYQSLLDPASGEIYLATLDANGNWVNAVDTNFGGTPLFVLGAYSDIYGLGAYGVDPLTHTVWAVVNHNSEFAAVPEPATIGLLALGGLMLIRRNRRA